METFEAPDIHEFLLDHLILIVFFFFFDPNHFYIACVKTLEPGSYEKVS